MPAKISEKFDSQRVEQRQYSSRQLYRIFDLIVAYISAPNQWEWTLESIAPDTPCTIATRSHSNNCITSSMCNWTIRDTVTSHWYLHKSGNNINGKPTQSAKCALCKQLPLADLYPYKSRICGIFCNKQSTIVMMLSTSATTSIIPFFI